MWWRACHLHICSWMRMNPYVMIISPYIAQLRETGPLSWNDADNRDPFECSDEIVFTRDQKYLVIGTVTWDRQQCGS